MNEHFKQIVTEIQKNNHMVTMAKEGKLKQEDYTTKRSKALDLYCNEKGMRRGMMTEQDHEDFVEWLADWYFCHKGMVDSITVDFKEGIKK